MIDHHTASSHFTEFHQREQLCGRRVAADWRWIVPPQASAATDVFHLKMKNFHPVPNYYYSRADRRVADDAILWGLLSELACREL